MRITPRRQPVRLNERLGGSLARVRICLLFAAGCLFPVIGEAVIILEKGSSEPMRGFLVDADENRVIVDVLQPDGQTKRRILPRTAIEEMIQAVSVDRLASLSSDRPEGYRDYAEELAGKTHDPEAQQTALRLYQIAAYLAPEQFGRSCLLGMAALARNPAEARKFRAAAYLLDSDHNRSLLRAPKLDEREGIRLTDDQRQQVRGVLRALREGRINDARSTAKRPALQDAMKALAPLLVSADFERLRDGESLPPAVLYHVLAAEMAIDPQGARLRGSESLEDKIPRSAGNWFPLSDPQSSTPVPVLKLELLTEFDPQLCHFRNGKWEK